ncbi:MAG: HAD family hydrolase [Actinomycetota bacterium]|nr:HAD family hydrolase [Actinomycetota bacterium]
MNATRSFDAVLFDFGGTLFGHTTGPQLVVEAARTIDVDLAPEVAVSLWADIDAAAMDPEEVALGRDLDASVWQTRWAVLYGLADRAAAGLGAAIDATMNDPWAWLPHADAVPVLETLQAADVAIGLVSNTGWDVRAPFAVRGIERFLGNVVLSYEVGLVKPDPAIFLLACEAAGSIPSRTLFVGDNPWTDGGAIAAGLGVLLVPPAALGAAHGLMGAARLAAAR